MQKKELFKRAKAQAKKLASFRKDVRYLKTIGRLKYYGLIDVKDIQEYGGPVFLADALLAAQLEPRIYELLPAIMNKHPKIFRHVELPEDLATVVKEIRQGVSVTTYKGIEPKQYLRWIPFMGRKNLYPKIMRSFRLSREEIHILDQIQKETSQSHTEILRNALKLYAGITSSLY